MDNTELAVLFLLQVAVILLCCRAVGWLAGRLGQPQVIAEMVTGILLGPSLFGWLLPGLQAALFPWDPTQQTRDTQSYLFPVAQLGLVLYMFVVGLEFDVGLVRRNQRTALAVSVLGILAPFALGAALGFALWRWTGLFPARTGVVEAILFVGTALSITAFPMLARIVQHKQLGHTRIGNVAIAAGAMNDAAAFGLLALVLASLDADYRQAFLHLGGAVVFVAGLWLVVRPMLVWIASRRRALRGLGETELAVALATMAACAWCTERLGLHGVFGAFLAGCAMPREFAAAVVARLRPLVVALLLPLFFTFSGLHTRIALLDSPVLWGVAAVVLVVAVVGKAAGCWAAARACGMPNREALGIGVLMNARGLMELIVLNIGLQRGLIGESLFAIFVLMAVATTLMTSPLLDLLGIDGGASGASPRQSHEPCIQPGGVAEGE